MEDLSQIHRHAVMRAQAKLFSLLPNGCPTFWLRAPPISHHIKIQKSNIHWSICDVRGALGANFGIFSGGFCNIAAQSFAENPPAAPEPQTRGGQFLHKKSSPLRGLCPEKSACCDESKDWAMNPNVFWGWK